MKYKSFAVKIAVIAVCLSILLLCGAYTEYKVTKVLLPNTKVYKTTDINSEVVATLSINDEVETLNAPFLVGSDEWQKISAHGVEGFVFSGDLYESKIPSVCKFEKSKLKSAKMGENINLYLTYDGLSQPVKALHDGQTVSVVVSDVNFGEYRLISYENDYYFVKSENLTKGLSYNQLLAVIIASSVLGVGIIVGLSIYFVKKNKYNKKKD